MSRKVLCLLLVLVCSGCGRMPLATAPSVVEEPPPSITAEAAARLITDLGFDTTEMKEHPDFFLVEGDILFAKDRLATFAASGSPGKSNLGFGIQQAANIPMLTRTAVSNITVYIDASIPVGGVDDWRPEITQAMSAWTDLPGSCVAMTLVSSAAGADIVIKSDGSDLDDGTIAAAQFPLTSSNPGFQVRINLDFRSNQMVSSALKLRNMVHEFGHCIAFRHTNWEKRGEANRGGGGRPRIPDAWEIGHGCPSSDPNSVMNGGTALTPWSGFSQFDVLAAELIYPQWADYSQLGGAVWTDTEAMTALNGMLYIVENSRLYRVDPIDGSYVQLGGAVWAGTDAMTTLGGMLYIVENSRLYRVDSNDGSYVQLGGVVWAGTEGMAALNGMLYIVENSRLYRVDPNDGSYVQLGGVVWAGTEAMTTLGGMLFIVENSRLYRVNPSDGSYVQLGGAVWAGTAAMTANNGSLYIVENDLYYRVSPADGSYVRMGGIAWNDTYAMTTLGTRNYIAENHRLYSVGIN